MLMAFKDNARRLSVNDNLEKTSMDRFGRREKTDKNIDKFELDVIY